jgi:hypothetical protein
VRIVLMGTAAVVLMGALGFIVSPIFHAEAPPEPAHGLRAFGQAQQARPDSVVSQLVEHFSTPTHPDPSRPPRR